MSWKDKLLQSSFKGVPFHIEDVEIKSGRRIVSFEFPKLSTPATEDLGRKQRSYSIQAYIIGEDYLDGLTALIDVCESEAAGILVHPFFGEINVQCEEIAVKQSMTRDGNIALISLAFVEAGQELYPDVSADQMAQLSDSKTKAITSSKESFVKKFSVAGKGQLLINSATTHLGKWTSKMDTVMSSSKGESNSIASMGFSIRNLKTNGSDMVSNPLSLADNFSNSISGLKGSLSTSGSTSETFSGYKKMFSTDNSSSYNSNPLTETRRQELRNQKAIDELAVNVSTVEAAEIAANVEYESYEDAVQAREVLLTKLDDIASTTDNDDLYLEITKMRSLLIDLIPPKNQSLPELKSVKSFENENALTLSYRLYGNVNNESVITKRNKISNPLFIPSDKDIEVPIE